MLLYFDDGERFATGAINYEYRGATEWDESARIMIPVEIGEFSMPALLDTGAPFVVCTPEIAEGLQLDRSEALREVTLRWHGTPTGYLFRENIIIRPQWPVGAPVFDIDATIFVPDEESVQMWHLGRRPLVLGLGGMLERMRFAVDPNSDTFFFGRV